MNIGYDSRKDEKLAIYHRNASADPIDMNNLENEQFHRQKDIQYAENIQECLSYIYEHDKYRKAVESGAKDIHYSSKKYERRAVRSKRRKSINRVNDLFAMLEKQNADYKKLSYC